MFASRPAAYSSHFTPSMPGAACGLSCWKAQASRAGVTWCISDVNLSRLFRFAASRTQASTCDTVSRLCVRPVLCRPAVPLAPSLPSIASAPGCPGLFGCFLGTMGGSDFPRSCISGSRPKPSRCGLAMACQAIEGPPGSRAEGFPTCVGSRTAQGRRVPRYNGARRMAFRFSLQRQRPGVSTFRGSIPSPLVPLSTLRRHPRG
jgi:hypothetical protein